MTGDLVRRLGLFQELEGHTGCVNCIQWNKSGDYLASGSDDKTVIVWDGIKCKKLTRLETPHEGNIFSVVWLPGSDDTLLATGAGDCRVCVINTETGAVLKNVVGHYGRVKRLTVAADSPGLVWSGGEDGVVRQWDMREKWSRDNANVLINLTNQVGRSAEVKCVCVCSSRTELVAVGANDPYVRVYDRRMITCSALDTSCETRDDKCGAVAYFVPGHLPGAEVKFHRRLRPLASTYITYNNSGTELLCNLGGEQVYLYDKWALYSSSPVQYNLAVINNCDNAECGTSNGENGRTNGKEAKPLPAHVEKVKKSANVEFEAGNYNAAVCLYNQAIVLNKTAHPILHGNRAAALMKRAWDGDTYAALRDCLLAMGLDPGHVKAHLRLAQCLMDLEWLAEADQCLENFKLRHPEFIKSKAFSHLLRDLNVAKDKIKPGKGKSKLRTLPSASSPVLSQYSAADFLRTSDDGQDDTDMDTDDNEDSDSGHGRNGYFSPDLSRAEVELRMLARDYSTRYLGTCNTTTDIKEANFLCNDQYIMAGSDDGKFFIWNRETANIERVLIGDDHIVNCLQSNPFAPILATSGIDPVVRIWQPMPENGDENERLVEDLEEVASSNQRRMNADPFETILLGMGYRINVDDDQAEANENEGSVQCRPS